MKNIKNFLSESFHFLGIKFSVYLNRHVFVMILLSYNRVPQNLQVGVKTVVLFHYFL